MGGTGINTSGSGNKVTIALTTPVTVSEGGTGDLTLTDHGVLVGKGTNPISTVPLMGSSGIPLISQGALADPVFGVAVVQGGGTGQNSFSQHSLLLGNGTNALSDFLPQ